MSTYYAQAPGNNVQGVTVKVDYADVAGAYAGWFLLVVQGDNFDGSSKGSPNEPQYYPTIHDAGAGAIRQGFLGQANARLNAMLGVGHCAKWSATIVESVTPAVIDDTW